MSFFITIPRIILAVIMISTCMIPVVSAGMPSSDDGGSVSEELWNKIGLSTYGDTKEGAMYPFFQKNREYQELHKLENNRGYTAAGSGHPDSSSGIHIDNPSTELSSTHQSMPQDTLTPEFTRSLGVGFIPNHGQYDPSVAYILQYQKTTIFFTQEGLILSHTSGYGESSITDVIQQRFGEASQNSTIIGHRQREGHVNYYVGNESSQWLTDIPIYQEIQYEDLYPGIDLHYFEENGKLKREFRVAPGASPDSIEIQYGDGITPSVDDTGILRFASPAGEMLESPLICWQVIGGEIAPVKASYKVGEGSVRIFVGDYYPDYELIIDPELVYSTYLGGLGADEGHALTTDGDGGVWVTGRTISTNFPLTRNANQARYGGGTWDLFLSRFSPTGELLYSTYVGGVSSDEGKALATDGQGGVWVTGQTKSTNFPITDDAHQGSYGGGDWDAFLSRFSPTGEMLYSTYLGGSKDDAGYALTTDSAGFVWVTGQTESTNFPVTSDAHQGGYGGGNWDAFLSRFSPTGEMLYSTYLGGNYWDHGRALAPDGEGGVWIAGNSLSTNFPLTADAYQRTRGIGGNAIFISRFSSVGTLLYSTYFGESNDQGHALATDGQGGIWIAGQTKSASFPITRNAYQNTFSGGEYDAFLSRFSSKGTLLYSTYLGGSDWDGNNALAADGEGGVWVAGHTYSSNFPVTDGAFQNRYQGAGDAFISRFAISGDLLYSTYLGGSGHDSAQALATDGLGGVWIAGDTRSTNFPMTVGAFQGSYGGGADDAFVSRFSPASPTPMASFTTTSATSRVLPADPSTSESSEGIPWMIFVYIAIGLIALGGIRAVMSATKRKASTVPSRTQPKDEPDQITGIQNVHQQAQSAKNSNTTNWIEAEIKKAHDHIKVKHYHEALVSVDKILKIQPKNDKAWFIRGVALFGLGRRTADAIKSLDQALAIQPDNTQYKEFRAKVVRVDPRPDISLSLQSSSMRANTWQKLPLILTNSGKDDALNVSIAISDDFETRRSSTHTVKAGASELIEIPVQTQQSGHVPLDINITYKDTQGRAYKTGAEFWIDIGDLMPSPVAGFTPQPQTPRQFPTELADKYTDIAFIEKGGFGRVFRATRKDGTEVAIKIPISLDAATGKSFIAELQSWTKLSHPNIVRLHDYNIMPIPYFEMEYCGEGSLADMEKPLAPREAAWLIFSICEGLKVAHLQQIIHRDLKPHNILMKNGVPKVSDWGLAKVMSESATTTTTSFTTYYAAPEQFASSKKDERTDIWQIGIIFYELVTGVLPFKGGSMVEIMASIATKNPTPPGEMVADAAPVQDIILKCLEKEPKNRYQSVLELQWELARYLEMNYTEELKKSVTAGNTRQIVYYCGELVLTALHTGDLKSAHKYLLDLQVYAKGEMKKEVESLAETIQFMLENGLDVSEDTLMKADMLVHRMRVG